MGRYTLITTWIAAFVMSLSLSLFAFGAAKKPLGADCKKGGNKVCASGYCDAGPESGGTNKCVPKAGTGKKGQYCSQNGHCRSHICSEHYGYCWHKLQLGKHCESNANCLSGWCDTGNSRIPLDVRPPGTNKCVPARGKGTSGQYCSVPAHCKSRNCVDNKCGGAKVGAAKPCKANASCISGTCDLGPGGMNLCLPEAGKGKNGEYCTKNSHCLSRACLGRKCADQPKNAKLGAPCARHNNCKSGYCDIPNGPDNQRCVPKAGRGKNGNYCTNNGQCMSRACLDNKCKKLGKNLPPGTRCVVNQECASNTCGPNAAQRLSDDITGVRYRVPRCVAEAGKGKKGDHCVEDGNCLKHLACSGFNAKGEYKVCGPKGELGAHCRANSTCASGWCDTGRDSYAWDPRPEGSYKCVPARGRGRGGDYCAVNAHCKSNICVKNECGAIKPLGGSCPGGNTQCTSGFCDAGPGSGNTNKCVPKAGTGKTGNYCSQNAHCKSKTCSGNKCSSKKGLGQSCPNGNSQCTSGFCDAGPGSGNSNKCVPRSGTGKKGDYCSQNGHCRPGKACVNKKCK